jgi:hypothetical protein
MPPSNFPAPEGKSLDLGTMRLPDDLPAPVRRHLLTAFGEQIPIVETAVFWGRARMKPAGLWMPARYRAFHQAGAAFVREMHVSWMGIPVVKGLDTYIDGRGMTKVAGGTDIGAAVDQGANIVLWAEQFLMMPSVILTHPRVRWQAVDDNSARLIVPLGEDEDSLTFWFDPQTGLASHFSTMRYRTANEPKLPWRGDCLNWRSIGRAQIPSLFTATWEDQGQPWSYWHIEKLAWNVEVGEAIRQARLAYPDMSLTE